MVPGEARPHSFTRELGVSEAEFFRSLPGAIEHREFTRDDGRVHIEYDGRSVTLELGPQAYRAIASLRLPYLEVTFTFSGFSEEDRARFMERFELYFRGGGG